MVGCFGFYTLSLTFYPSFQPGGFLNMKKKGTEFYLLRQKHLSEADLFITDYIKTKQRVKKLEQDLDLLKLIKDKKENDRQK